MNNKIKNILVIGGAGYIGSVITEEITTKYNVIVYDNLSTGYKKLVNKNAKFIKGDMLNTTLLAKIIKLQKIDVVILMAASIVVSESTKKPLEYFQNNIGGLLSVLKAMKIGKCNKLLFASSAAVYGNCKLICINEECDKSPCNPYGWSKLICEQIIQNVAQSFNLNYILFRIFNVAGASNTGKTGLMNTNSTLLIHCINKSIINKNKFQIFGHSYNTIDGTASRDYIHVLDVANAFYMGVKYLLSHANTRFIFNIGQNKGYTVKQVYDLATKLLKIKSNFEFCKNRIGDPSKLLANNKKITSILKWRPKKTLQDMIMSDYYFQLKNNK